MVKIKWAVAILLILAGIPFVLLTTYIAFTPTSAQFRELNPTETPLIDTATQFIHGFRAKNSRNPRPSDFDSWKAIHAKEYPGFDGWGYSLLEAPFPDELREKLGPSPNNAFVLSFWDGSAFVDYASWFGGGKLAYVTDSDYFSPFGGKYAAVSVFSAIWITFFGIAFVLLPRRRKEVSD
jgi:hypothetical protein